MDEQVNRLLALSVVEFEDWIKTPEAMKTLELIPFGSNAARLILLEVYAAGFKNGVESWLKD